MSDYPSAPQANYPTASSYPEPGPSTQNLGIDASNSVSPELPSKWWPWLIGFLSAVALGFQIWSLMGLLGVEKQQAAFDAKVEAWYEGDKDRQKTLDSWREIKTELDDGVQELRKKTVELEGSLEGLRTEQDGLAKKVETEKAILANLKETRTNVESSLASAKAETLKLESRKTAAEESHSSFSQKNSQLTRDIEINEQRLETIKSQVERQQTLVKGQATKLSDLESEIKTTKEFLDARKSDVAKLQQEIQKQASLEKELAVSQAKLKTLQTKIAAVQGELDGLNSEVNFSTKKKETAGSELTTVQKRIDSLKSEETKLSQQIIESTKALGELTSKAAELSSKATEMTSANLESFEKLAGQAAKVTAAMRRLEAAEKVTPPPASNVDGDN